MKNLAWMQRVAALGFVSFWGWFFADHSDLSPAVVDFEWCFVVPDLLWITPLLLFASFTRSVKAAAAAGGSMVFLGLLDAGFNLRHGQYAGARGAVNLGINAACVLFGLWNLRAAR